MPETNAETNAERSLDTRRWWALLALSLAVLLVAVDGTVLNVAIPALTESLQPTRAEILWIGDIYSFILAGLLITMGSIGDRIGRKRLLLLGSLAFGAASVICALSQTSTQLIAGRALLGVAGATLMPSTLSLIRSTFESPKERAFAIGVWSAMGGAGASVGPVAGGLLLERFWWGSVFIMNVPIVVVIVAIGLFSLRESRNPEPGPIDAWSVVLSLTGIIAFVYGIKELALESEGQAASFGVMLLGLGLIWVFVRRQTALESPLIDVRLFSNAQFSGAVIAQMIAIFGLSGVLFFISQYFQFAQGLSPLQSGLRMLPATAASAIAAIATGMATARLGHRKVGAGGLVMAGIGLLGLAVFDASAYIWVALVFVLIGAGVGFTMTVSSEGVLSSVPPKTAGAAAGVSETSFELGTAFGIALLGSLLTSTYSRVIDLPAGLTADAAERAGQSVSDAYEVAKQLAAQGQQTLASSLEAAYRLAFEDAVAAASVAGGLSMLVGALIAWRMLPSRITVVEDH